MLTTRAENRKERYGMSVRASTQAKNVPLTSENSTVPVV